MKLLVTGVTGYIGGSVAKRLIEKGHQVRGLVRPDTAPETLKAVEAMGVTPVVGELDDYHPLKRLVAEVDGVVNAASSDNVYFVTTVLEALRGTGKTFIHTSGSSIVGDKAEGRRGDTVYTEGDFRFPPEKAARVAIDRTLRDAAREGVRTVVICPTLIYGEGLGVKKTSIQVPMLRDLAIRRGGVRYIGPGENIWSNVHIADLSELYLLALEKAPAGSFFFAENGEASMREVGERLQRELRLPNPPQSITIDEGIAEWGPDAAHFALGGNSRVTSALARRQLGWKPTRQSLLDDTALHL
jgi:nucleoside-diphosphate-sugar epimerase